MDWAAVASSDSADLRPIVRELQIIQQIALLHRGIAAAAESAPDSAEPPQEAVHSRRPVFSDDARRWGPLVVMEAIGSGAYGEVFRAWDTNLDREVALKLLKRRRATRTELQAREGQLLARVVHPNVMAVHGAAEIDGQFGVWGELLRGRTLSRIVSDDGPLSADEALVFADAVCRALATAHRAGLLHRDVKAQNVMREQGGRIVLMDFGLGRELADTPRDGGELAGTPLYMAPELFTGGRASVQTDIYSVGVLMFFLVTGTFPVTGRTFEEIARRQAEGKHQRLQDLRPDLPTAFANVVERATAVDPARRFESCGAMQSAVAGAAHPLRETADQATRGWRQIARHPLVAAAAMCGAVAAIALMTWFRPAGVPDSHASVIALTPPPGTELADSSRSVPSLSPDGRFVVIVAGEPNGDAFLWRQDLQTGETVKIPNSDGAVGPFWGRSGDQLGFFDTGGKLRWGSSDGRRVDGSIDTEHEPRGAAWSDGVIIYPRGPHSGLYQLALATGRETPLIALNPGRREIGLMYPQFLADGQRFIYFVFSNDDDVRGIYLASLAGGAGVRLVGADAAGIVSGDTLLFPAGDDLVGRRVSGSSLDSGSITVARGVASNWDLSVVASASRNGSLVYLPDNLELTELVWFSRSGQRQNVVPLSAARHRSPAISRDGQYLAVERYVRAFSQVEIHNLVTGQQRLLIDASRQVKDPVWGPGHRLLYSSIEQRHEDLWTRDIDSDEAPRLLFGGVENDSSGKIPIAWSADGRWITFLNAPFSKSLEHPDAPALAPFEIRVLEFDGTNAFPLKAGAGAQIGGVISPNGLRAAYRRRQLPTATMVLPPRELWICDFPSGANSRSVGVDGIDLAWPSNEQLSYLDSRSRLRLLRVPASPAEAVKETAAFETGVSTPGASRNHYAWSPNGERVLVNLRVADQPPLRLRLVLNALRGVSN